MMMAASNLTEDLRRSYWQDGHTIAEIARQHGKHPDTMYDWFVKLGIPRKNQKEASASKSRAVTPAEVQEMICLYEDGKSSNDIGKQLGRDGRLVRTHLKAAGVLRKRVDAMRLAVRHGKIRQRSLNEAFFDVLTPESAWVLGLIYGDGHVANNSKIGQYQVTLAGAKGVCAQVQALLGLDKEARQAKESRPVKSNGKLLNCWILQWSSRVMVKKLGEHGLKGGSKARTMIFPSIPKELLSHFVRGLWDSDGAWNRRGNSVRSDYACSSLAFISILKKIVDEKTADTSRFCTHQVELCGKIFIGHRIELRTKATSLLRSWVYNDSSPDIRCERKFGISNGFGDLFL